MARVIWLPQARHDVERLHTFLHSKDPEAAQRAAQCIFHGAELLETAPGLGRLTPNRRAERELFMAFGAGAYVLRYRTFADNIVVIVRVWHSRESR